MGNDFGAQTKAYPSLPVETAQLLVDPLNRYFRYPWLQKIAEKLKSSWLHPDHLTWLHTCVGLLAVQLIYREHDTLGVCFFELRMILSALGSRLVRVQSRSTPRGRTLEMLGDALVFNALMCMGALRLIQDYRNYNPAVIVSGVAFFAWVTAQCGTVYQLMRRKLGGIIRKETDAVEIEWRQQYSLLRSGHGTILTRIGYGLDSWAVRFVSPEWYQKIVKRRDASDWEDRAIRDAALMNELACVTRKREFKSAVKATALMSDNNIFAIIGASLLGLSFFPKAFFPGVHPVLIAFGLGLIYGIVALGYGLLCLRSFLHGVYRE